MRLRNKVLLLLLLLLLRGFPGFSCFSRAFEPLPPETCLPDILNMFLLVKVTEGSRSSSNVLDSKIAAHEWNWSCLKFVFVQFERFFEP